jgi:hypothetical protein
MEFDRKLYVPNANKWMRFYSQINRGNVNPYANHTMKGYHRGGGLRNKTSPFMMSIDSYAKDNEANGKDLKINVTSPAEQIVEQAKSEIKRENITKKEKHGNKRRKQKATVSKEGPAVKRNKVVKIKSDVFGLY